LAAYFLDSSAIAKLYHLELGSSVIRALATGTDGPLYISRLAVVEVPSAFAGKVRAGELTAADMLLLRARFRRDLRDKLLRTVAINAGHFRDAEKLVNTHGLRYRLRTLDALQLGVALYLQQRGLVEIFVCADKPLCQVAEVVGLTVLNPETSNRQ
jgi:predicted nucleic acid-binding protein